MSEILQGTVVAGDGRSGKFWCELEVHDAEVTGGVVAWEHLHGLADVTGGSVERFTFRSAGGDYSAAVKNGLAVIEGDAAGPATGLLTKPGAQVAALESFLELDVEGTIRVLAGVLLPSSLPAHGPTVDNVVDSIAGFLRSASGKEVQRIRTLLQIIGIFVPLLEPEVANIRKLVRLVLGTENNSPLREALAGIHQIVVFAYYAHTNADKMLGYARKSHLPNHRTHLPVTAGVPQGRVFDVVIAGTGPAGSLLADRLSSAGKSVLLLEAGPYIPEDAITTNELDSIARLYKSSGLQVAGKPSSVTVLQGSCVGGGGVINNGLFFAMSTGTLERWRADGFPFDADVLGPAYQAVAKDLNLGDIADKAEFLNPTGAYLEAQFGPAKAPPLDGPAPPGFYRMLVNLETRTGNDDLAGCRSTGLCNLGCGSERKVNSYQHYLKNALDGSRDVVLVPDATVTRVILDAYHRVTGFEVRQADGRTVMARGKEFILSCGPVASSGVLLRSDRLPALPVGRRFSGNVASPMFATAPKDVNLKTSVQMCQVYVPGGGDDGFLIETWFSPPGGLALAMPGFLETHARRMAGYAKLLCASPVIGTQPIGKITQSGEDTVIDLPLAAIDLDRFRRGMLTSVNALLKGGAGSVIVRLGSGRVIDSASGLAALDREMRSITPRDLHLLPLSTAHPQGGNALSSDPRIGVVGADFRVRGVENLRVCDGSVFPMGCDVNPQWTIFALAHLCAAGM
jgi:choline dehydrogenase-like flavoprotein